MLDQQFFESADKQLDIKYLTVEPKRFHINKSEQRNIPKISQDVQLKFQSVASKINARDSTQNQIRNISFQVQVEIEIQTDRQFDQESYFECDEDSDEESKSTLWLFYQNKQHCEKVYQKNRNIGTSWIGRKEYFTSLFIKPQLLHQTNKHLFGTFSSEQEMNSCHMSREPCSFDSDFESGNLFAAYKTGVYEYDLLLQNDINTKGNTQWFYFRISNPPVNRPIKINIVNFRKSDSLFNYGMLPCFYSAQAFRKEKEGWVRKGSNVKYYRNSLCIENSRKHYYTLSFTISTTFSNDTIKIAQCYPYTYSDLNHFLTHICKAPKDLCHRQTICRTLGRNKVECLTVKDSQSKFNKKFLGETKSTINQQKPIILVLARQHPGETPGSFMMEGLIEYLALGKDKDADFLRKNYEIKLIPMVNPDGVVVGNYRTNLFGFDLNRRWDCTTKTHTNEGKSQPLTEVVYIKRFINNLAKGREIAFILDFHGHSRKMFSFFYGNTWQQSPTDVRAFPFISSKLTSMIRFEDSTFSIEDEKRSTARIQFLLNHKICNIYTFEASFFGYVSKTKIKKHFTIESYKNLGLIIGKSIYICEKSKETQGQIQSKEKLLYDKWIKQLRTNASTLIKENADSGSESCPQQCEVLEREMSLLEQQQAYKKEHIKKLNKSVKLLKKKIKHEIASKETQKVIKNLQVLDIARVNSIFPNDVLALVPSTFYLKSQKGTRRQLKEKSTQTEDCPFIRIYESCKNQDEQEHEDEANAKSKTLSSSQYVTVQYEKEAKTTKAQKLKSKPTQFDEVGTKSIIFQKQDREIELPFRTRKSQSISDVINIQSCQSTNIFHNTLKNLSSLTVDRRRSNEGSLAKQRQLSAIKRVKAVEMLGYPVDVNYKKSMTEHQLSRKKSHAIGSGFKPNCRPDSMTKQQEELRELKNPHNNSKKTQTAISFLGETIKVTQQSFQCSTSSEMRRNSLGSRSTTQKGQSQSTHEARQFHHQSRQFRRTVLQNRQIDSWKIKKKSLI